MPDKDTLAPLSSQLMNQMRAGMRREGRLGHDDHFSGEGWRGYDDTLNSGRVGRVQPTNVPTLLVGGSVDFSTPVESAARELLPFLKNGDQVVLRECGHVGDVLAFNPPVFQRLLTGFLDRGETVLVFVI